MAFGIKRWQMIAVACSIAFIVYWYGGYVAWWIRRNNSDYDEEAPTIDPRYGFEERKYDPKKLSRIPKHWILANMCPACYGMNLCEEIDNGKIQIEIPNENTTASKKGVFYGSWNAFPIIIKKLVKEDEFKLYDNFICKQAKLDYRCDVSKAILHTPMMKKNEITSEFAKKAFAATHTSKKKKFTPSFCMTDTLIRAFKDAFFTKVPFDVQEGDKPMLAMMYTNLVLNPEGLMLSFLTNDNAFHDMVFPKLLGACGRVVVVEDAGIPLDSLINETYDKRITLALNLMSLVEHFLYSDSSWLIFYQDFKPSDFSVNALGEVRLIDVEDVMIIDNTKSEQSQAKFKENVLCNAECFNKVFEDVLNNAHDTTYKSCAAIKFYSEVMMALLCNNILSDMDEHKKSIFGKPYTGDKRIAGLLHSAPASFVDKQNAKLKECVTETSVGGRKKAWDTLRDVLVDLQQTGLINNE